MESNGIDVLATKMEFDGLEGFEGRNLQLWLAKLELCPRAPIFHQSQDLKSSSSPLKHHG